MKSIFTFMFFLTAFGLLGQKHEKKTLEAISVETAPKIDGFLDDEAWINVPIATDFIQLSPEPLAPSKERTEVKIVYTNDAVYVAAKMYAKDPKSILTQLTARDAFGNSDWFGIWFSCYNDGINGFEFFVTPDGVQMDAQISAFGEDFNWNAVWESDAVLTEDGWSCEMRIPYSAIRFPDKAEQSWDVNFIRDIRKTREKSFWNTVDPKVQGTLTQSGRLTNIKNIIAPPRLFLFPYFSAYQGRLKTRDGETSTDYTMNGGMDLKLGLSDAFTLDMTLIPDFGQVVTDDQVLNLSAFEVQFPERRQFFTEGTELFNKGNIFYSRRIGGRPINYYRAGENDSIVEQPNTSQLINAAKISGRTSKGLGIGFFNAVTKREFATVTDREGLVREVETSPLTNYSVLVLDQNLKNNSYVSLINTNVLRDGSTYDANVIGTEFSLRNKENSIELKGGGKFNKKTRQIGREDDEGYAYGFGLSKTNGQLNFGLDYDLKSKFYDPNDLGFLRNPNEVFYGGWVNYSIFEPFWKDRFNSMWSDFWIGYSTLQAPNVFQNRNVGSSVGFTTRNFDAFGGNLSFYPGFAYDYFEPRIDGLYFRKNPSREHSLWFSSDYSKKFALDLNYWQEFYEDNDWFSFNYRISPRLQIGDQWQLIYVYSRQNVYNQQGFAGMYYNDKNVFDQSQLNKINYAANEAFGEYEPIFSTRDRITHTNKLTLAYVINNRMSVEGVLRHYWSTVKVSQVHQLEADGSLSMRNPSSFGLKSVEDLDINFNAFTINLAYRYVFAPGSEISIVWINQIEDDQLVYTQDYGENFSDIFTLDQLNSFSIKILYFIDYFSLMRK